MSELSIFLFFLFLFSFFVIKLLHQIFNGFSFFALDGLHKDREQPFRYGRAVFTFFGGPSRIVLHS